MEVGDICTHSVKLEWGAGVVVEIHADGKVDVAFERRGTVKLDAVGGVAHLVPLPRSELPPDSALLDQKQWNEVRLPPDQRGAARRSKKCEHCGKSLHRRQWSKTKAWKSCPHCSIANGRQHIFYEYPDGFGRTDARATKDTPEGPQSYCEACRFEKEQEHTRRECPQAREL